MVKKTNSIGVGAGIPVEVPNREFLIPERFFQLFSLSLLTNRFLRGIMHCHNKAGLPSSP